MTSGRHSGQDPAKRAMLLTALYVAQEQYGHLSPEAVERVADRSRHLCRRAVLRGVGNQNDFAHRVSLPFLSVGRSDQGHTQLCTSAVPARLRLDCTAQRHAADTQAAGQRCAALPQRSTIVSIARRGKLSQSPRSQHASAFR